MAEITGFTDLKERLQKLQNEAKESNVTVVVGFTQNYAIYVHENLEARHRVGQAKFLEQPARELAPHFGTVVRDLLSKGVSMLKALFIVGLRLQRDAQKLCPVLTGALKNSAFTRQEK